MALRDGESRTSRALRFHSESTTNKNHPELVEWVFLLYQMRAAEPPYRNYRDDRAAFLAYFTQNLSGYIIMP